MFNRQFFSSCANDWLTCCHDKPCLLRSRWSLSFVLSKADSLSLHDSNPAPDGYGNSLAWSEPSRPPGEHATWHEKTCKPHYCLLNKPIQRSNLSWIWQISQGSILCFFQPALTSCLSVFLVAKFTWQTKAYSSNEQWAKEENAQHRPSCIYVSRALLPCPCRKNRRSWESAECPWQEKCHSPVEQWQNTNPSRPCTRWPERVQMSQRWNDRKCHTVPPTLHNSCLFSAYYVFHMFFMSVFCVFSASILLKASSQGPASALVVMSG